MRYLLDECLSALTAKTMGVLGAPDDFVYIRDVIIEPTGDPDIPDLCKTEHFDVLVTINVKDFEARKPIYQAVIDAGIHVLVLRRQRRQPTNNYWQVSLLARHYPKCSGLFGTAKEATLGSLSDSGVRAMTLTQIMADIEAHEAGKRSLP